MRVLVINSGSSSIKFSFFESGAGDVEPALRPLCGGELSGVGGKAQLELRDQTGHATTTPVEAEDPAKAIHMILDVLDQPEMPKADAIGYRVVHPGAKLEDHQRITPEVLRYLDDAAEFAPLHDPEVTALIREAMSRFPNALHYACFDTVFHRTMPVEATTYPIPQVYRDEGARRYGFHGLSCESIVHQLRQDTGDLGLAGKLPKRMVVAHLGSGCSVTALLEGRSIDTTMGLTPTGGVVMGTRPGDLDPGLLLYLLRQQTGDRVQSLAALETMLNHASGMVALSGLANDVKALRKAAEEGEARAVLALRIFTRSITKAIGAFSWLLGGLDAVIFAGGIGEHDSLTRADVFRGLEAQGILLDGSLNEAKGSTARRVSASDSQTAVLIVPAQEDLAIAMHVIQMSQSPP